MKTLKTKDKTNFEDYYPFDKSSPILGPDVVFNTKESINDVVESVCRQTTDHWMKYFKAILDKSSGCGVCAERGIRQIVERLLIEG